MELLLPLILLVIMIIVLRLFGAWMLRINDVIHLQKDMLNELKKLNKTNIS